MFSGIFGNITRAAPTYDPVKLRPLLKMGQTRLRIVHGKRRNAVAKERRELADFLKQGNIAGCRVRVESVMREESAVGGFEILAMLTDLVASRLPTITNAPAGTCPPDLKEAITSIIWASPYVGTGSHAIPEFSGIKTQFAAKFSPEFVRSAEKNSELSVHEQLRACFDMTAPSEARAIRYMESICEEFNIPIDPEAFHSDGVLGKNKQKGGGDESGGDSDEEGSGAGFSIEGHWIPELSVPRDDWESKLLALKRAWG